MIFGARQLFAVEIELNENHGGAWLFGKICYWIKGSRVGNFEEGTSLRDVLMAAKWIEHDHRRREGGALCGLEPNAAFLAIDAAFGVATQDMPGDVETPARFNICPEDVTFKGWRIYLVECGDQEMILYKHANDASLSVGIMQRGVFEAAFHSAYATIDSWHEMEEGGLSVWV